MADSDNFAAEFQALRALSARIGSDPLLVQAAGGNTSIKDGNVLWVKASGTWLARALDEDIMVPVAMPPLLKAVADEDPAADTPQAFIAKDVYTGALRPSIETTVHACMPQRIVVHVHCVSTIAAACQADVPAAIGDRLDGYDWALIPYVRPGLPLARAIIAGSRPDTNVLILGNHGLAVAADTVAEADDLLARVCRRLALPARSAPAAMLDDLVTLGDGAPYRLPAFEGAHRAATNRGNAAMAAGGSLYPDHVIFLGVGSVVAGDGETAAEVMQRARAPDGGPPLSILFPGKGVLMREDANAGAEALALCLGDVLARIPPGTALRYLTNEENAGLLNWDAEKYRQALNKAGQA